MNIKINTETKEITVIDRVSIVELIEFLKDYKDYKIVGGVDFGTISTPYVQPYKLYQHRWQPLEITCSTGTGQVVGESRLTIKNG